MILKNQRSKSMKKVIVYYAYDDTEFYDEDECMRYEQKAIDLMVKAKEVFTFYDKNMNVMSWYVNDNVDDLLSEFENVYDHCDYIKVNAYNEEVYEFIYSQIGLSLPGDEEGLYEYDWTDDRWIKIN